MEFSADTLADVPHYIGYLKQLGLDYGYGPTATMEWVLEHVHVFAGTPWWVSILLTGVLARLACAPLYLKASDNAARLAHVMPFIKPLRDKMVKAQSSGDMTLVMQYRAEIQTLNKRAGVSMGKAFLPLMGGLTSLGQLIITRAMSNLPVHSLESGGALWFPNLTVADPYFILPALTAVILHVLLRQGGESGVQTMSPGAQMAFQWGLPALSFAFTVFFPAACQLGFLCHGLIGYSQATLMKDPSFRKYFKMAPLPEPKPAADSATSNYKGAMKRRASPVLSQEELRARLQGSHPKSLEESKSGISKVMGDPFAAVKKAIKPIMDQARERQEKYFENRRLKSERAETKAYETRRRKELNQARRSQRERRREVRASKKYEGNER